MSLSSPNPHDHSRPQRVAVLFSILFVLLSLELVTDPRTYLRPPSRGQAVEQMTLWMVINGLNKPGDAAVESGKLRVIEWMSAQERFHAHRLFLVGLILLYLLSAIFLWKKNPLGYRLAMAAFLAKISHTVYFLWTSYAGRVCVSNSLNLQKPPLLIIESNEIHYGLGALLAVIGFGYFVWLEQRRRFA